MLAYRLIQTQIERTYLQIITSAEPDFEDELGLYYQALLDLRNGRPHLVMILESFGGDDPSPVQMEGLRAVSFAQLADMPVSMTPLLRDNLPQALAEILFSKMAGGVAPAPIMQTTRNASYQAEQLRLLQIQDATCAYIQCSAATERAITRQMIEHTGD